MPNATVEWLKEHGDGIPFPLYCTRLQSGVFVFVNKHFATLLDRNDFASEGFTAEDVYFDEADRKKFKSEVQNARARPVAWFGKYKVHGKPLHLVDIAQCFDDDDHDESEPDPFVIGILADVPHEWQNAQLAENRVKAFERILDWIEVGVHRYDAKGILTFMNRYEQRLLNINDQWLHDEKRHVCELSPEKEHDRIRQKVEQKIKDDEYLTKGEHRQFRQFGEGKDDQRTSIVPVNIRDIEVKAPDHLDGSEGRNHEIFTIVTDERLPKDIISVFERYGPRNPLLEQIGIATFIKMKPRHAFPGATELPLQVQERLRRARGDKGDDLVFTFGNDLFVGELRKLTTSHHVDKEEDIWALTDRELWGPRYGVDYANADRDVTERGKQIDQRVEAHPALGRKDPILVQVVKLPVYGKQSQVIGVHGFYWTVSGEKGISARQKDIRTELGARLRHEAILDDVPLPLFMKDKELRFTYANRAYIEDLKKIGEEDQGKSDVDRHMLRKVESLHDVIGWTDHDLFKKERADEYKRDDDGVVHGTRPIVDQREGHGRRRVRVIKKPIKRKNPDTTKVEIVGLQGIFWSEPSFHLIIDRKAVPPRLYATDGKQITSVEIGDYKYSRVLASLAENLGEYVESGKVIEQCDVESLKSLYQHILSLRERHLPALVTKLCELWPKINLEIEEKPGSYRLIVKRDSEQATMDV